MQKMLQGRHASLSALIPENSNSIQRNPNFDDAFSSTPSMMKYKTRINPSSALRCTRKRTTGLVLNAI